MGTNLAPNTGLVNPYFKDSSDNDRIRPVRVFVYDSNIFCIKSKAPTFVRANFYGAVKIDFDFIVVKHDFFYKAINQKFRFCFERVGVEFAHRAFGQLYGELLGKFCGIVFGIPFELSFDGSDHSCRSFVPRLSRGVWLIWIFKVIFSKEQKYLLLM